MGVVKMVSRRSVRMFTRKKAFTLIELLTVIAIIAILSAIILPVLARSKDSAYRSSDISRMNDLRSALQLYRADQGGFPPALLGYVTTYSGDPLANDIVPANLLSGFLYPKRVNSLDILRPSQNRVGNDAVTTAVWPPQDPRPVGTAPTYDANRDGVIDATDDLANARQRFGPGDPVIRPFVASGVCAAIPARFYRISGYDVAPVPVGGSTRNELRYALFWTRWSTPADPCNPQPDELGNILDDPRQLGYDDPPENTVVTWNSFFREYTAGVPTRTKRDIVLLLGGSARVIDSRDMAERSWRVTP
ncbi:MAG: type II secretion system protein [Fimbriimonadaceae bacterium]